MKTSQQRAIENYRLRLGERGLARFEVLGRESDRDLIRSLARALASGGPDADALRESVNRALSGDESGRGGILAALRRSPLVGAELDLRRSRDRARKAGL